MRWCANALGVLIGGNLSRSKGTGEGRSRECMCVIYVYWKASGIVCYMRASSGIPSFFLAGLATFRDLTSLWAVRRHTFTDGSWHELCLMV